MLAAEADLAEFQILSGRTASPLSTNEMVSEAPTNKITAALSSNAVVSVVSTNAAASDPFTDSGFGDLPQGPSREKQEEYRTVCLRIGALRSHEWDLRATFTDESRTMIRLRDQIANMEKSKKRMEEEDPELRAPELRPVTGSVNPASPVPSLTGFDLNRTRSLDARVKVLRAELDKIRAEIVVIEDVEASVTQLLRRKELEETNYRYFAASLEQARISEAFEAGQLANIGLVQAPSPPVANAASRLKSVGMVLFGCLFAGLGLAFLIELVVDRTVRRPFQVESGLLLPLFFSIPRLKFKSSRKRFLPPNKELDPPEDEAEATMPSPLTEWAPGHPFRPHLESLRDQLLMHFEGDGHKPKLIGITSCREGAGVTTLALGLASALSETGDGKVLFVNLDFRDQSLHPFFRGKPARGLNEVLENRETGIISRNLYLADASTNASSAMESLPRNISRIMPKLKLSDYDFIVFDLPRVTRTSITPGLAGMMDLVLMVVESEKEPQEMVKRAAALMQESQARVSVVLNKLRTFVPARLHREL